jgi:hypothetical protein
MATQQPHGEPMRREAPRRDVDVRWDAANTTSKKVAAVVKLVATGKRK